MKTVIVIDENGEEHRHENYDYMGVSSNRPTIITDEVEIDDKGVRWVKREPGDYWWISIYDGHYRQIEHYPFAQGYKIEIK